ncbi:hypothetical protein Ddc_12911 [Ditylenchus destructor]|nr:hypothetical protein Ddc_12911 [Ditylenchus destructor]
MGLSLPRPSKASVAKLDIKLIKTPDDNGTAAVQTLPKVPMKIGQVKLHTEVVIQILKYFSRKRLCELKLVNLLFAFSSESSALKTVHVISSLETPAIINIRLLHQSPPKNDPRDENEPVNRYQQLSEQRLEHYIGFNGKGYPSFSVFDRPPLRHIRFRYVTLSMGDKMGNEGMKKWILDHKHCFTGCILECGIYVSANVPHFRQHITLFDRCCSEIVLVLDNRVYNQWPTPTDIFSTCDVLLSCNTIHLAYEFSLAVVCLDSILYWLHFFGTAPRKLIIYESGGLDVNAGTLIERIKIVKFYISLQQRLLI